ncbi:PHA/PHB synthase family protein [Parvularcula oceani]|uniref:PHA/PHB synthase family protein n=1 Tax=Parvularcula oceani TaxID=1247963 RepID=UPI00056C9D26|nr:alpha/beta fold hydrolase [Parvularcula oceani]
MTETHSFTQARDGAIPHEDDAFGALDRMSHIALARLSGGVSPLTYLAAWTDWIGHLAIAPGTAASLAEDAVRRCAELARHAVLPAHHHLPLEGDRDLCGDARFRDPEWSRFPFAYYARAFLATQGWWRHAAEAVPGVSRRHRQLVSFSSRQALDLLCPSNGLWTNPKIAEATLEERGANLVRGLHHLAGDLAREAAGDPPEGTEGFAVGKDLAVTPGRVVHRDRLVELIQYEPATDKVAKEPILIVPAWIMKYYVLDLSPHNSLVRDLIGRGHTVFMVSWRNPEPQDRDIGMDDYLRSGILEALGVVDRIAGGAKVHLVGYCLGGTLAAVGAALLGRRKEDRLASLTLLAAQTDFEQAGELSVFIDESQLHLLEDLMWQEGVLDSRMMGGAFQILRSRDLIWSRLQQQYWLGERPRHIDLMAWNADGTRMPARMHAEYLRHFYLDNDFAEGRLVADGEVVALSDIRVPIFALGTAQDHVAPWRSVYAIHLLADTDVTFALASGGHNGGIVSEPGHSGREYRMRTRKKEGFFMTADEWMQEIPADEGSWWPAWSDWLKEHSSGEREPPVLGEVDPGSPHAIEGEGEGVPTPAPGTYVLQR